MKISEILKSKGFFSKDIKNRFRNNQILVDGLPSEDIDIQIEDIEESIEDAGIFIFNMIKEENKFVDQLKFFGIENLKNSNIKNDLTKKLEDVIILRVSKKEIFIMKNSSL